MQIRPKAYLHLIWLWRWLRDSILPHHGDVRAEASPILIYVAVVLAFLLAILEVDAHRGELEALGLSGSEFAAVPAAVSP
jgi:hypothetical protein